MLMTNTTIQYMQKRKERKKKRKTTTKRIGYNENIENETKTLVDIKHYAALSVAQKSC